MMIDVCFALDQHPIKLHDNSPRMLKVVQLEKYFDFSLYSHHFSLLSLTSLLSAPEREVTSPSNFKVVGALINWIFFNGISTHYPDSEPTSLWSYSMVLLAWQRSSIYQCHSLRFDLTWAQTQDLLHLTE